MNKLNMESLGVRKRVEFPRPMVSLDNTTTRTVVLDIPMANDLMYSPVPNVTEVLVIYLQSYFIHNLDHGIAMKAIAARAYDSLNPYVTMDDDHLPVKTDASMRWEISIDAYMSAVAGELAKYDRCSLESLSGKLVEVWHMGGTAFGIYPNVQDITLPQHPALLYNYVP